MNLITPELNNLQNYQTLIHLLELAIIPGMVLGLRLIDKIFDMIHRRRERAENMSTAVVNRETAQLNAQTARVVQMMLEPKEKDLG